MKKSPAKNYSKELREIAKKTGLNPKKIQQAAGPGSRGSLPTFKSSNRPYSRKKKPGLPTNKTTPFPKGVRKGGVKKGKTETPGPIVAFALSKKPGTSKNIGPQESPKEIARKRNLAAERTKGPSGTVFDAPKKDFDRDRKEMKDYEKAESFVKMKNKNVASAMKMKTSPALVKLSASCKAAAKRKFKVYPSAYANMWAAKTQRQGKC